MIKNYLRKICFTIMALVMMITGMPGVEAYAKAVDVSDSVVKVVTYLTGANFAYYSDGFHPIDNEWDGSYSSGTGFFVGEKGKDPKYLLTNNHVIDDYLKYDEEGEQYLDTGYKLSDVPAYANTSGADNYKLYIVFDSIELRVYYNKDEYDKAFVLDHGSTEKIDLAILQLKNPTNKRKALPLQLPDDKELRGETVYAYGFPGATENTYSAGTDTYEQLTLTSGVYNQIVSDNKGVERVSSDAKINHGNSGGPLCTPDGYVIGVNTNGYHEDSSDTRYYAISTKHVVEMLSKNSVPFRTNKSKGGSKALTIVLVIAGVVVAAGAAFAVLSKKNKGNKKNNTPGNGYNAGSQFGGTTHMSNTQHRGPVTNIPPISGVKNCPRCGKQVDARSVGCPFCGTRF